MTAGGAFRLALAFAVLIVLHYTLRPLLAWRVEMNFLVIALLLAAVRVRPGSAAVIGCLLGLASDSLTPSAFGTGALAMTVVGYSASWLKAVFFADNLLLNGFFFFAGELAYYVLQLLIERRVHGVELLLEIVVWAPLSAAATAVAGILLIVLLRPLLEAPAA
jgi:rod shape-determining protein MreD